MVITGIHDVEMHAGVGMDGHMMVVVEYIGRSTDNRAWKVRYTWKGSW